GALLSQAGSLLVLTTPAPITNLGLALNIAGYSTSGASLSRLRFRYISCSHAGTARLSTTTRANPFLAAPGRPTQSWLTFDNAAVINKEPENTCNECLPNKLRNLNRRSVISFRSIVRGIHQIT